MRRDYITILLLTTIIFFRLDAQNTSAEIPWPVKVQFMEDYVSASKKEWQKDEQRCIVKFLHHGYQKTAIYAPSGHLLEAITFLSSTSILPAHVQARIRKRYQNFIVDEIKLHQTSDGNHYSFLLHNERRIVALTIDNKLKVLRKQIVKLKYT